jgi:NitT/TauT family transport system ATP-binding protein
MLANATVLAARGICLRYPGQNADVLSQFDLSLRRGEIVSVLGPSGIGKSSLLRVLAGLQKSTEGSVMIDQHPMEGVHPRVAIAFQDASLLPWLSLERNVGFGLGFKHQPKLTAAERRECVDDAIEEVGLSHARSLYPSALSGGMAQRAALARCLARKPEILLLDEPFGALDEVTRAEMQKLLVKIVRDFGTATLLITHDIDEALLVSDRIVLLGGAPAREVGHWTIDLPQPRGGLVAELGARRIDILKTLDRAMVWHH